MVHLINNKLTMIKIKQYNKAWIGIGISNTYISILKNLRKILKDNNFSKVIIMVANKINNRYNNQNNKELENKLLKLANKIELNGCEIKVIDWSYLDKNEEYLKILKKYEQLFNNDLNFKKDVETLVIKNRSKLKTKEEIDVATGYVLEEISSTIFFNEKEYVKIGPNKQEKLFDELSIKWGNMSKKDFDRF